MTDRDYGTVSTYNGSYAFITPDGEGKDVFAYKDELPGNVHRGDRVSYELAPDPYKPGKMLAKSVRFVDEGEPDETESAAQPGMYREPEVTGGALAEGLQKLLRNQ